MKLGRCEPTGGIEGVFFTGGGGTYPGVPLVGVLEFVVKNPLARRVARRSPGKDGAGMCAAGIVCDCGNDTCGTGGVAAGRCAFAMMSARLLEGAGDLNSGVCGGCVCCICIGR